MIHEFNNETWYASEEKDFYIRTLKSLRYHKSLDRLDAPTTTLLFISRFDDPSIRQHFEDSSRHFKTYNAFNEITGIFTPPHNAGEVRLRKMPHWFLNALDTILRFNVVSFILKPFMTKELREHFSYRAKLKSLTEEELANELSLLFQMIGFTNFSKLNVIIGSSNDRNVETCLRFICEALNNSKIKALLANKNILIPDDYQTHYGVFNIAKNKLPFKSTVPVLDLNKPLMKYLEKKTQLVMDRKRVKDLIDVPGKKNIKTMIIGRRILTRGHDPLNESALIQSYDYKKDIDLKYIQVILKRFLKTLNESNTNALIVIENFPNQISYLISRDEELKSLLHGKTIALACVEPETKDIYTFESNQFVQKSLRHIF